MLILKIIWSIIINLLINHWLFDQYFICSLIILSNEEKLQLRIESLEMTNSEIINQIKYGVLNLALIGLK
jgi:hypothetical protein